MTTIKKDKVVRNGNHLIDASYSLPKFEMKLLQLVMEQIKPKTPQPKEGFSISVKQFKEIYGCDTNVHTYFSAATKNIRENPIRMFNYEWQGKVRDSIEFAWCTVFTYTSLKNDGDTEGTITLKFSPELEPCLFELKEKFTTLNFDDLAVLDTPFSMRLYTWIASRLWKGERQVNLDIEWMKLLTGLSGKHDDYRAFRIRVLDPAVEKINQLTTTFLLEYKPVRKGRNIKEISFNIIPRRKGLSKKPKPIRPRLPRRPKVKSGSHEEGVWAKAGIKILEDYFVELQNYSDTALLDLKDVDRLVNYYKIIGERENEQFWQDHAKSRAKKKA